MVCPLGPCVRLHVMKRMLRSHCDGWVNAGAAGECELWGCEMGQAAWWGGITVELCVPSSLGKMAPDGDLPPSLLRSSSFSLPPSLPPSPRRVINPLLFMKIYNMAIQLYDAPRPPIGRCLVTWLGAVNMNFFIYNFQYRNRAAFSFNGLQPPRGCFPTSDLLQVLYPSHLPGFGVIWEILFFWSTHGSLSY